MVDVVRTGVVYELPVAIATPPVGEVNQLIVAPGDAVALRVTVPEQTALAGVVVKTDGLPALISKILATLEPQLLVATTLIVSVLFPKVTTIAVVPCPDVMEASDGTVQVYEVAPATGVML